MVADDLPVFVVYLIIVPNIFSCFAKYAMQIIFCTSRSFLESICSYRTIPVISSVRPVVVSVEISHYSTHFHSWLAENSHAQHIYKWSLLLNPVNMLSNFFFIMLKIMKSETSYLTIKWRRFYGKHKYLNFSLSRMHRICLYHICARFCSFQGVKEINI